MDVKHVELFLDEANGKEELLYKYILQHTDKIVFYLGDIKERNFPLEELNKVLAREKNEEIGRLRLMADLTWYRLYKCVRNCFWEVFQNEDELKEKQIKNDIIRNEKYYKTKYIKKIYEKVSKMPYKKIEKKYSSEDIYTFSWYEENKKVCVNKYCICEPSEEMLDYFINEFRCFDIELNGEKMNAISFLGKDKLLLEPFDEYYNFFLTEEELKEMDELGIPYVED